MTALFLPAVPLTYCRLAQPLPTWMSRHPLQDVTLRRFALFFVAQVVDRVAENSASSPRAAPGSESELRLGGNDTILQWRSARSISASAPS
ncbi:hypothetical protein BKA70DRAFT_1267061 [Coprinopsis sp. MPI-PUGE-AT-0042]|nr:hypothetical protein BKA70DRAFT_1267061 [Coprinopsis sp. MPI-PUGE-AT-0042]